MIKRLCLENFKSFKKLELPEISTITLIGGQNNVGKTSLLEAIFLFYDQESPGMFLRHLAWRGIDIVAADAETIIAPALRDFDLQQPLKIAVDDEMYHAVVEAVFNPGSPQQSISVGLDKAVDSIPQVQTNLIPQKPYTLNLSYTIDGQEAQSIHLVIVPSLAGLNIQFNPGPMKPFPEQMRHGAIYLGLRMKVDPGEDALRFSQLDIEKRSQQVREFLQVLEPSLEALSAVSLPQQRPAIYADIGMKRKIPVAFLGEGMSRLLSIILAIATAKNGIVLIDEVDTGIHHSRMAKIWEGICKAAHAFDCQIFATTHSYECLQAALVGVAQANMDHDFRYVRLDRHGQETIAKTYTHEVLGAALARGWEVR
jgi:predicted ATP-dependent endonuclease of OLD family